MSAVEATAEPLTSGQTTPHLMSGQTTPHLAVSDETLPLCKETNTITFRKIVRNFTPSWFAVNMGTGIVSVLLNQLPYNAPWVIYISYAFFVANVVAFLLFLGMTILRYALYPEIWSVMIGHPRQSLFLGCFPMGLATIINMIVFTCADWGDGMIHMAWAFWWLDAVLSVATCISMPFVVMHRHRPGLQNITAALLLPIVPTIVCAATGGIVAEVLPNKSHALTTVITSYILWGIGEFFAACVLALYFHRLTIHSLPPREVIVSVFLPIGPLGQGAFGIQQLGKVALDILPQTHEDAFRNVDAAKAGEILYVMGVFLGIILWGFGLVWLSFALISILTTRKLPFNMAWWGFTFPLGVMGTSANLLAKNLDSEFFKIAATIIALAVVILWTVVAIWTARRAITGEMFQAPCLKDLTKETKPKAAPLADKQV